MNEKILGYKLDKQQQEIVYDNSDYLLVLAGAGSGKTLTIIGKIKYLIKEKKISPEEILTLSFTNESTSSLEKKLKKELSLPITTYTFHKLALTILKQKDSSIKIAQSDTLENIVHEFFYTTVTTNELLMKKILNYFNQLTISNNNIKLKYLSFVENNQASITNLEKLLVMFIHLFKCNNYQLKDFSLFLKRIRKTFSYQKYKKEKILLILLLNIYLLYIEYLEENNEYDFDDLIIKATTIVKEKNYPKKLKYIIIDEYQDTSYIRFLLIREIIEKTKAKLMVVGDDFQSIYSFTGCDLSLFLNFNKYFSNAKILKIETTYRNSQQLITTASNFILKNKNQLPKKLISIKRKDKPIKIVYYTNIKHEFKKVIAKLERISNSILILGRNNNDVNLITDTEFILKENGKILSKKNSKLDLTYMTTHKSKGLEADNVIIINLRDNILGFPSQIQNVPIIRLVTNKYEKYPFAEERRLFYVALTRTKNYVYLLVPKINKSIFIEELIKDKKYVEIIRKK